jgi:hypothetical protein
LWIGARIVNVQSAQYHKGVDALLASKLGGGSDLSMNKVRRLWAARCLHGMSEENGFAIIFEAPVLQSGQQPRPSIKWAPGHFWADVAAGGTRQVLGGGSAAMDYVKPGWVALHFSA